jgi:hypothetical protein
MKTPPIWKHFFDSLWLQFFLNFENFKVQTGNNRPTHETVFIKTARFCRTLPCHPTVSGWFESTAGKSSAPLALAISTRSEKEKVGGGKQSGLRRAARRGPQVSPLGRRDAGNEEARCRGRAGGSGGGGRRRPRHGDRHLLGLIPKRGRSQVRKRMTRTTRISSKSATATTRPVVGKAEAMRARRKWKRRRSNWARTGPSPPAAKSRVYSAVITSTLLFAFVLTGCSVECPVAIVGGCR